MLLVSGGGKEVLQNTPHVCSDIIGLSKLYGHVAISEFRRVEKFNPTMEGCIFFRKYFYSFLGCGNRVEFLPLLILWLALADAVWVEVTACWPEAGTLKRLLMILLSFVLMHPAKEEQAPASHYFFFSSNFIFLSIYFYFKFLFIFPSQ